MPIDNATQKRGGGKPPISAHPAFPAVVALWFAALLGIGSLILPVRLYETVLTATGISSLLSAAAPPLGFTARTLIALVATVIGAGLGFVLARKLTRGKGGSYASERADSGRRPLNPVEDLDDDGFDDDLPPIREMPQTTGRRRALAMTEEEGPSELLNAAPLPGDEDDDFAGLGQAMMTDSDYADDYTEDALELSDEVDETPVEEEAPDFAAPARQEFAAAEPEVEATAPEQVAASEPDEAPASAMPEPLPFSPPSLTRSQPAEEDAPRTKQTFLNQGGPRLFDTPRMDDEPASADAADLTPATPDLPPIQSEEPVSDNPFTPDSMAPQPFSKPANTPHSFAQEADMQEPQAQAIAAQAPAANSEDEHGEGLVQLVQKLGNALEKHREWSAQRASAPSPAPAPSFAPPQTHGQPAEDAGASDAPIPQAFDAAGADDAAEAMAAYFGKPAAAEAPAPAPQAESVVEAEPEAPRAFDAPKQVFQAAPAESETVDPMHPSNPAPVAGETYAPFTGFGGQTTGDDEDEDDDVADLAASFQLPITPKPAPMTQEQVTASPRPAFDVPPPAAPAQEEPQERPAPARDADYSALAANNPFKSNAEDFVRIDEPEPESAQPAVVFPNQQHARPLGLTPAPAAGGQSPAGASPASNDDNERALREALMNLQRMGK